ncbi:uncharacterized protein RSE6_03071 [Rhynchosporium secalis]|uniref:Beta-lactamase-related domain-containing protein n=1 Tax=Rhynchosporium secalis TaxID=38038 RepID=A0A1E1M3B1_RHYSE|nr:uncharacterized protein RSE6_03071 [Rhynchosporium secalis]
MLAHLLLCLCLVQCLATSLAQNHEQKILRNGDKESSPLNADLERLIKSSLEAWHVPGISIGVFDGDEGWAEGYGIATLPSTPVTPSTLFYGASTTKAFTAAVMEILISSSNYSKHFPQSWKTPVSSLIPEDFVLEDPWATAYITIEDILSHRTGSRDMISVMEEHTRAGTLRQGMSYCNMMYVVAGHIIETLTGGSLESFIKKEIWEPLGMTSTSFSNSDAISSPHHFAQGYVFYNNTYLPVPYTEDLITNAAAGSIISNVLDYTKWIFALLYSSPPPEESYRDYLTPRMLRASSDVPYTGPTSYALGWETSTYKGYEFYEHSGVVEAFGSHVIFFPEIGFGVCAFGNTGITSNVVELIAIWRIIDERLGVKEEERFDWGAKIDVAWKIDFDSEHISGDYFMAYVDSKVAPGLVFKQAMAAEFRVGSGGTVEKFGIALEPEMGTEGRIWFERV